LGHDLGHPPFGHAGEAVLKQKLSQGFCHSRHSVRIATVLEPLNLTFDVLEAIAQQEKNQQPLTLETRVVELADRMAYLRHDVEDALRAGLLKEQDIPAEIRAELGQTYAERLDTLVKDLVWTSLARLEPLGQQGAEEEAPSLGASAEREVETLIALSPERFQAMQALRGWMFRTIYLSPSQQSKDERVQRVLEALLDYYFTHPDQLPPAPSDEHAGLDEEASEATALEQRVGDYIAGMTDRFALKAYQELLLPQPYGEPLLRF
jgi:dGTPase